MPHLFCSFTGPIGNDHPWPSFPSPFGGIIPYLTFEEKQFHVGLPKRGPIGSPLLHPPAPSPALSRGWSPAKMNKAAEACNLALGRWRQESGKFKFILSSVAILRAAWMVSQKGRGKECIHSRKTRHFFRRYITIERHSWLIRGGHLLYHPPQVPRFRSSYGMCTLPSQYAQWSPFLHHISPQK